jgi:uncharacterized protein (TIGR02246 family)
MAAQGSMLKTASIVAAALSFLILPAVASAEPADIEAWTAANAMVGRVTDAWNCSDGAAYGENYWVEAELRYPVENVLHGQSAIIREHVNLWAGPFRGSHAVAKIRGIQLLDPNHALVDFDLVISWQAPNSPVVRTYLKHILENRNGIWKIVSGQNTFAAGRESITSQRPPSRSFAVNR